MDTEKDEIESPKDEMQVRYELADYKFQLGMLAFGITFASIVDFFNI